MDKKLVNLHLLLSCGRFFFFFPLLFKPNTSNRDVKCLLLFSLPRWKVRFHQVVLVFLQGIQSSVHLLSAPPQLLPPLLPAGCCSFVPLQAESKSQLHSSSSSSSSTAEAPPLWLFFSPFHSRQLEQLGHIQQAGERVSE